MMTPKASPKRSVGSIGSLAQLGAISSANTQNSGSTSIATRPIAHVAQPVQSLGSASQIAPVNINTPVAHPVGVSGVNLHELSGALSTGPTQIGNGGPTAIISRPVNYPLRPEE